MAVTEMISSLRSFKLFQNLTVGELSTIAEICISKHYRNQDCIFLQSEEISYVFFQLQGRVKLFSVSESGNEQTFMIANQGELFPHVGFFKNGNYPYHAVALKDSVCFAIPIESFKQLLITYPSIHFKIAQVLADKVLEFQQRLEDKTFYTTEGQLVSLLLRLGNRCSTGCCQSGWELVAPLTNSEIAGLLGTTRETVNRIINKLKKQGAVIIGGDGRIRIHVHQLQGMLPITKDKVTRSEKWSSIRHSSNQCCISYLLDMRQGRILFITTHGEEDASLLGWGKLDLALLLKENV